jgi:hypothetical protein
MIKTAASDYGRRRSLFKKSETLREIFYSKAQHPEYASGARAAKLASQCTREKKLWNDCPADQA